MKEMPWMSFSYVELCILEAFEREIWLRFTDEFLYFHINQHGTVPLNFHSPLQDYPEHRLQFFSLLRAITNACGSTLFAMSPQQLKLVIDSIVWAFRHTERNVADTGLNLLLEMLSMFDKSEVATQFYQTYYMSLVREIFAVLTGKLPVPLRG